MWWVLVVRDCGRSRDHSRVPPPLPSTLPPVLPLYPYDLSTVVPSSSLPCSLAPSFCHHLFLLFLLFLLLINIIIPSSVASSPWSKSSIDRRFKATRCKGDGRLRTTASAVGHRLHA